MFIVFLLTGTTKSCKLTSRLVEALKLPKITFQSQKLSPRNNPWKVVLWVLEKQPLFSHGFVSSPSDLFLGITLPLPCPRWLSYHNDLSFLYIPCNAPRLKQHMLGVTWQCVHAALVCTSRVVHEQSNKLAGATQSKYQLSWACCGSSLLCLAMDCHKTCKN